MKKISKDLRGLSIRVKEDYRDTYKPGWKFSEYEVKGVPIRIAIGPRDLKNKTAEIVRRDTLEKDTIALENISHCIENLLSDIQSNLFSRAESFQKENTYVVDNFEDFKEKINLGGFVLAHWDGSTETEDKIKQLTKATIRCIPIDSKEESGKCIFTGKPSCKRVVFAKSY